MQTLFPFLPSTVLWTTDFNQKMLTHIKNTPSSVEVSHNWGVIIPILQDPDGSGDLWLVFAFGQSLFLGVPFKAHGKRADPLVDASSSQGCTSAHASKRGALWSFFRSLVRCCSGPLPPVAALAVLFFALSRGDCLRYLILWCCFPLFPSPSFPSCAGVCFLIDSCLAGSHSLASVSFPLWRSSERLM